MIWYAWLLIAGALGTPFMFARWLAKKDVEHTRDPRKRSVLIVDVPAGATDAELEEFFFRQNVVEALIMEGGVVLGFMLAWAAFSL